MAHGPVMAWATQSGYPIGFDVRAQSSTSDARIALRARCADDPINSIDITFDHQLDVSGDSGVSLQGTDGSTYWTYRIAAERRIDHFGYGRVKPYWYINFDCSSISNGTDVAVTGVVTNLTAGGSVDAVATGRLASLAMYKQSTPFIRYLDTDSGNDSNDGESWDYAWKTIAEAEQQFATPPLRQGFCLLYVRGSLVTAGVLFDVNLLASDKMKAIVYEPRITGGSLGAWACNAAATNNLTSKGRTTFIGFDFDVTGTGSTTSLRNAQPFVRLEDCAMTFANKGNTGGTNFQNAGGPGDAGDWFFLIEFAQTDGFSGLRSLAASGHRAENTCVHGYTLTESGTGLGGAWRRALIEDFTNHGSGKSGYNSSVHFDFGIHAYDERPSVGSVTHSPAANRFTAGTSGAFANDAWDSKDWAATIAVLSGTGATIGSYRVTDKDTANGDWFEYEGDAGGAASDFVVQAQPVVMRDMFVDGVSVYNCGTDDANQFSGAFLLTNGGVQRCCLMNLRSLHRAHEQQIIQLESIRDDVEIVQSTLLAQDSDEEDAARGIYFSPSKLPSTDPSRDITVWNTITPQLAGAISGATNATLGPNLMLRRSNDANLIRLDGSVTLGTTEDDAELSQLLLINLTETSPNLRPKRTSPARAANGVITAEDTDLAQDASGQPYNGPAGFVGALMPITISGP